jgi:hypothetical protein
MKILNTQGFSKEERMGYVPVVYLNIVRSTSECLAKIRAANKFGDLRPESLESAELLEAPTIEHRRTHIVAARKLWEDPLIRENYNPASYFPFQPKEEVEGTTGVPLLGWISEGMDEVLKEGFVPSDEVILHCRTQTLGINELVFPLNPKNKEGDQCTMVDVGGQRSERRKWIHCFQDVTSVLFFVSLTEYDQTLVEASEVNRLTESFKLFADVCNCSWFVKTPVILFLNKNDLFIKKIQLVDLGTTFPAYKGGKKLVISSYNILPSILDPLHSLDPHSRSPFLPTSPSSSVTTKLSSGLSNSFSPSTRTLEEVI